MSDWTAGYVADIGYTFGYYSELNPLNCALPLLNKGFVCPEVKSACELGFGQGMSANMHAAATVTQWHGTDFNPSHAGFAQELAGAAGSHAQLHDDAFIDFCKRPDLPDFDYIGLHGIWSWISDANRAVIVDFVRRKLKVGGVLYVSYNTLPGWSAFAPMRHLMTQQATVMGSQGNGVLKRVEGALDFAEQLLNAQPAYARAIPAVTDLLKETQKHSRSYLAHEYFNADWLPMYFADMTKWLGPAKVGFACSAMTLEHVDAINLTVDQINFLKAIPDPMFKQSVRDYMVNQQFRRDYWIKGARTLSELERTEALRDLRFVLMRDRQDVPLILNGNLGELKLTEGVYNPILDAMADHIPKTLGELEHELRHTSVKLGHLTEAMLLLVGRGHVARAQDTSTSAQVRQQSDKLNVHLIHKARGSCEATYLASPVTGGGVTVGRFPQLFLLAIQQGFSQPHEWAQYTWNLLTAQGQRIVRDGKTLASAQDDLAELNAQASDFAQKQLPVLKALQVA